MAQAAQAPYGRKTQREPAVKEVHVLWITAGLSCDGDSASVTAATQPSIEDIVMGAIPGLPKVHQIEPAGSLWASAHEVRRGGNPARGVAPKGLQPVQLCRRNSVSQRVMIIVNNSGNWLEAPVRLGCWNRLWSGRTTALEGTGPL